MRFGAGDHEAYDWAREFDTWVEQHVSTGNLAALHDFQSLGSVAVQAHPSYEHYLPLLYAAGAARSTDTPRFFNAGYQAAAISMRSVLWS